jgi:hypothetical protein
VEVLDTEKEGVLAGGGKAVRVCEVDVMEDVVLPVLAIIAGPAIYLECRRT